MLVIVSVAWISNEIKGSHERPGVKITNQIIENNFMQITTGVKYIYNSQKFSCKEELLA